MEKSFNAITVDNVAPGLKADKGVWQAQLRQTVTTSYPSARVNNSLQVGGLFAAADFNLESQDYESIRICWVPVPADTTIEQVQQRLAQLPNARLYAIYSNNLEDVLTDEQKAARSAGLRTTAEYEAKHIVKDSDGNIVQPVQYKTIAFAENAVEDVDLRTAKQQTQQETPALMGAGVIGG